MKLLNLLVRVVWLLFILPKIKLGRPVAVKVLLENLSLEDSTRKRFFKEAQVLASLTHPNIVVLHDFIEFGDRLGLVWNLLMAVPLIT